MMMMQRLSIRRFSSLAQQMHFFSHCSSESATFRLLSHRGGDLRNACRLRRFSSISERDALSLEEDAERKMGWLLKLFFVGTAGFVGYQFFPYMGDNLLQQSISLLHVKDPLFKRMGASRLSRYAIDASASGTQLLLVQLLKYGRQKTSTYFSWALPINTKCTGCGRTFTPNFHHERRMKVVEMGGAQELLNMLKAAKDGKTRKEALNALVALSHSDLAAQAIHQAGAVSIISSTPDSSEHSEVELYKSSLLKRIQELESDHIPSEEGKLN